MKIRAKLSIWTNATITSWSTTNGFRGKIFFQVVLFPARNSSANPVGILPSISQVNLSFSLTLWLLLLPTNVSFATDILYSVVPLEYSAYMRIMQKGSFSVTVCLSNRGL